MSSEQAARDADSYLETVIETSHDGILVVDSEGLFEFGNEAFFRIFGWPADELIGHHFIKVVPPDMHDFILERWEEVQAGKGEPYEVDIVRKDGSRRSLLVSHRHMTIAGRRKYCVITKDVTDLKRAQRDFELLSLIAEQVTDSVIVTNLDFEITYVNRSFESVFGFPPHEVFGRTPDFLNVDPNAEQIQNDIYDSVSSGRFWRGGGLNLRKDGSTFPCEMTVFPLVNSEGKTLAYAGIQRDMTERNRADEALRQSQERFDLAVRGSSDGLWDWNACSERGSWWSPRVYELLGYADREIEVCQEKWIELLHPDDRDRTLDAVQANIEHDVPYDVEFRLQTGSGAYKWFHSRGITLRDDNGEAIKMAGSIQDIDDRKRAEAALARHREHLEEMVQLRTRELTDAQAELQEAHRRLLNVREAERRQIARELHDSVGQRLAVMLLGVRAAIDSCRDAEGHAEQERVLENVAEQCAGTIQDIRTICYGLYPTVLESLGLAAALRQLGRSCEPAASVHLDYADSLAKARFDSEHEITLFRIAQEAAANALRHGEATNVAISVQQQDGTLTLAVRDDGVGFDTQAKPERGLGLYSMRDRARAIGGKMDISSRPGETTVEVSVAIQLSR